MYVHLAALRGTMLDRTLCQKTHCGSSHVQRGACRQCNGRVEGVTHSTQLNFVIDIYPTDANLEMDFLLSGQTIGLPMYKPTTTYSRACTCIVVPLDPLPPNEAHPNALNTY